MRAGAHSLVSAVNVESDTPTADARDARKAMHAINADTQTHAQPRTSNMQERSHA
jgi:hypothetical protein